jgi:hypothetical protein
MWSVPHPLRHGAPREAIAAEALIAYDSFMSSGLNPQSMTAKPEASKRLEKSGFIGQAYLIVKPIDSEAFRRIGHLLLGTVLNSLHRCIHRTSLLVFSRKGNMPALLSHYRPDFPIYVITEDEAIQRRLALYHGAVALKAKFHDTAEASFDECAQQPWNSGICADFCQRMWCCAQGNPHAAGAWICERRPANCDCAKRPAADLAFPVNTRHPGLE